MGIHFFYIKTLLTTLIIFGKINISNTVYVFSNVFLILFSYRYYRDYGKELSGQNIWNDTHFGRQTLYYSDYKKYNSMKYYDFMIDIPQLLTIVG
jgi:hypothetical protein